MKTWRLRLMIVLGGLLAVSSSAWAATFTVNSTIDAVDATPGDGICATAGAVCTLRAAIQEANALAGTDTIVLPAGTYTLTIAGINEAAAATGDLDITSSVIIEGAGADVTTVSGGGLDRVFELIVGSAATLRGLRITGGTFGGIFSRGTLTVERCAIVGNSGSLGGGIGVTAGNASLSDTEVSGNAATSQGGGLNLQGGGTYTLTNVTVSGNTATNQFGGIVSTSTLTITNSTVAGNSEGLVSARNMIAVGPGATLRNTLFVSAGGTNCSGTITDGGGNFATGVACGAIPVTAAVATNLGALALNAPGTTSTHALLAGNPAIGAGLAGFCPAADQRGVSRAGVPCDSGAYQFATAVSTPTPTPTPSPGVNPTISSIANQTLQQNVGVTIPFNISGAVIAAALRATATASNPSLFPTIGSSITCDQSGHCTLQLTPADGRGGSAVVTISVSDGTNTVSQSFTATVNVIRPTAPGVTLANVVGSGIALTWTAPESGTPLAYAVAWGTAPGASNLPVQIVPGSVARLDFSSLPSGTYYFRVYAVGAGDVSAASPQTTAAVTTSATAPGPPMVLQLTAGAGLTARWRAPIIGFSPTLYEVQIGTGLGLSDVASATTAATSFDAAVSAGTYWVRTRAASGGAVGAWSSSVQIPFGSAVSCIGAPPAPTLLPVVSSSGQATLLWLAAGGSTADYYQLQISPGAGLPPVQTVNTPGPATSATWPQVGAYAARIVAINACGASARSNEVAFVTQP